MTMGNMNLNRKLLELQKTVRGLSKDSEGSSYTYVSGSKVLNIIRPKMDELGLLLIPEIEGISNERIDYSTRNGNRSEMFTTIQATFAWVDTDSGEERRVRFYANGQNGWDKGLGSAITYAERYFLLKFFHIATDEDDVDRIKHGDDAKPAPPPETAPVPPQAPAPAQPPRPKLGAKAYKQALDRIKGGDLNVMTQVLEAYDLTLEQRGNLGQALVDYKINNNIL